MVTLVPDDARGPERAIFLQRAGQLLASSLDPAAMIREVLTLAVPAMADWGIVYTNRPDGGIDRAAHHHRDPDRLAIMDEIVRRWPEGPRVVGPLERVLRHGETVLVTSHQHQLAAEAARDEAHRDAQMRLGLGAGLLVPLVAHGEVLGALVLAHVDRQRSFEPADIRVAEEIGRRAGIAFENALVHERLAKLQRITSLLTRPLTPPEVAKVVVNEGGASVGAVTSVLWLIDPSGARLDLVAATERLDPLLDRDTQIPLAADVPIACVAREGTDAYVPSSRDLHARWRPTGDVTRQNGAWTILALRDGGHPLGALLFGFEKPRAFDEATRAFLRALADQAGQALARAQHAEAALVRQQLLESQNEAALDGIFFQDAAGRPAFSNRRLLEIFGVAADVPRLDTFEERLARSLDAIADPSRFIELARRMEADRGASEHFELLLKDGRVLEGYTTPVGGPGGSCLGRVWYYRDVSEARRLHRELLDARDQLAQREKLAAMGLLVSGVAHEIRTPLSYAANHAYLLELAAAKIGGEHAEQIRESSAAIVEAVDRIDRLVQDLRRFTRLTPPAQACDLAEAARSAVRLFEATHAGHVRIELETQPDVALHVDGVQLQQVMLNLIENASDASPPGASVRLRALAADGRAIIEVVDQGAGIPLEVQARMWEPFFTTKAQGSGLGLSIVRRIAEARGGSVACESKPGAGTTFRIAFPLTSAT